jgi:hypothetical protein
MIELQNADENNKTKETPYFPCTTTSSFPWSHLGVGNWSAVGTFTNKAKYVAGSVSTLF